MSFVTRRRPLIGTSIILLLGQVGCAPLGPSAIRRSPEEIGAKLGTIGVASARFTPQVDYRTPPKGSAEGARRGEQGEQQQVPKLAYKHHFGTHS